MEKKESFSRIFGKRRISVLIFPCAASLILSGYLTFSVLQAKLPWRTRMTAAALAVSVLWLVLFLLDSRRISGNRTAKALECSLPAALIRLIWRRSSWI